MLAKGRRSATQVHGDVHDRAVHDTNQLVLGVRRHLKVQSAQGAGCDGQRVVVLHERMRDPGGLEGHVVPGLREEPPVVDMPAGNEDLDVGDGGADGFHVPPTIS